MVATTESRIVKVELAGRELELLYTIGADIAFSKEFGSAKAFMNLFGSDDTDDYISRKAVFDIADADGKIDIADIAEIPSVLTETGQRRFHSQLEACAFAVRVLANQAIALHNMRNDEKIPLVKEEFILYEVAPAEIAEAAGKILEAVAAGLIRNVKGESQTKKATDA